MVEVKFGDVEYNSGAAEVHSGWWRLILEKLSIILGLLRFILDHGG
jgi:hypothetical protein